MLRSMYSGISGLKNFQTKLDVIGNNIANVNTYGFKKERTIFKDLISQSQGAASGPSQTRGGVNAKQVGLGSQLAAIDTIHSPGSMQSTGRTLDLGIAGDGFFMVADSESYTAGDALATPPVPATITGTENILYTRAGNFYMDLNGNLVNGDGKYVVGLTNAAPPAPDEGATLFEDHKVATDVVVQGTHVDLTTAGVGPINMPLTAKSMQISQDGTVSYVDAEGFLQYAGTILMAKFSNAEGLEKQGSNYFIQTQNSGETYVNKASQDGIGAVNSNFLEMSNVDLSEEFTEMIVAQRGFQANSRIITTSDEILQELVNLKR